MTIKADRDFITPVFPLSMLIMCLLRVLIGLLSYLGTYDEQE